MSVRADEERWGQLIALLEPIHSQALGTARRLCRSSADGDDLYQETVVRAFEKLHTLRDPSRFRPWFFATLLSLHRSRCRRSFWSRFLPLEEATAGSHEPLGENGQRLEDEAWGSERAARALATLVAPQREAVVLFEMDGYSIEEIAAMQRVSISAVKSRLVRGRERLRRYYVRHGWDGRSTSGLPAASSRAGGGGATLEASSNRALNPLATSSMPRFSVKERSHE